MNSLPSCLSFLNIGIRSMRHLSRLENYLSVGLVCNILVMWVHLLWLCWGTSSLGYKGYFIQPKPIIEFLECEVTFQICFQRFYMLLWGSGSCLCSTFHGKAMFLAKQGREFRTVASSPLSSSCGCTNSLCQCTVLKNKMGNLTHNCSQLSSH